MERLGLDEGQIEAKRKRPEAEFTKVVEELIASGADLNEKDADGVVPVGASFPLATTLLQIDTRATCGRSSHMTAAAALDPVVSCAWIPAHVTPFILPAHVQLHVACCNNYVGCLDLLIKAGADLNLQDRDGETGLHLAAFFQNYKIVEMLGRAAADPEIKNRHKEAPIILTEDATMIRLIKAMTENTKLDSINPSSLQDRDRLGSSSVHRRTTLQKHAMAKMDVQAEFKKIEVCVGWLCKGMDYLMCPGKAVCVPYPPPNAGITTYPRVFSPCGWIGRHTSLALADFAIRSCSTLPAQSQYAELQFGQKGAEEGNDSTPAKQKKKNKGGKESGVVYSDLDFEAKGKEAQEQVFCAPCIRCHVGTIPCSHQGCWLTRQVVGGSRKAQEPTKGPHCSHVCHPGEAGECE